MHSLRSKTLSLLSAVAMVGLLASAASGGGARTGLRVYDPSGQVKTEVTSADVVRSSVRAVSSPVVSPPQPGRAAGLVFSLTKRGASKFESLTRALAQRGARLHRNQRFAVEVGGRIYLRPWVDYRRNPNGLPGGSGVEITGLAIATARMLVRLIRDG